MSDGISVTIRGQVAKATEKTSKAGNRYLNVLVQWMGGQSFVMCEAGTQVQEGDTVTFVGQGRVDGFNISCGFMELEGSAAGKGSKKSF